MNKYPMYENKVEEKIGPHLNKNIRVRYNGLNGREVKVCLSQPYELTLTAWLIASQYQNEHS